MISKPATLNLALLVPGLKEGAPPVSGMERRPKA